MTDTTASLEPLALISASRQPHALLIWLRHAIRRHYRGVLFWTIGAIPLLAVDRPHLPRLPPTRRDRHVAVPGIIRERSTSSR